MPIDDPASLELLPDNDLRTLVQQSSELSDAIFVSNPRYAEDSGFEPFSADWIRRYCKSLLSEISGKPLDKALEWALAATAMDVSAALVSHFGIVAAAHPAVIALAILLLRAARETNK